MTLLTVTSPLSGIGAVGVATPFTNVVPVT